MSRSAVIINGGNSKQSRLTGIQNMVEYFFEEADFAFNTIYVHDLPAEDLIRTNFASQEIIEANKFVEAADVIVVLTPIYKASFTGILKTYLDLLPEKALKGKVILPFAIGGSFGHLLAIEYALNPVLSALGATDILKSVYVVDQQIERLENNRFLVVPEARERIEATLEQLWGHLTEYHI